MAPTNHTGGSVENNLTDEELVPPGSPDWVTPERVRETLRFWQPRYGGTLTPKDAVEILVNVRRWADFFVKMAMSEDENEHPSTEG
jgi:hypothetical protein